MFGIQYMTLLVSVQTVIKFHKDDNFLKYEYMS